MKRVVDRLIIISLFLLLIITNIYANSHNSDKKVLFLSSYSLTWNSVPLQISGLLEGLGDDIIVDYEFMDAKNIDYNSDYSNYAEILRAKLTRHSRYDYIVVGDDIATEFALLYHNELFANIPIAFFGVDDLERAKRAEKAGFIGIVEKYDYETNLELAKRLVPKANNYVFIYDNSLYGVGIQAQISKYYGKIVDDGYTYETINASQYTLQQLTDIFASLDDNDIVFLLSLSEDKDKDLYSETDYLKIYNEFADVPTFRFSPSGVGSGLLGGYIIDHEMCAKMVGEAIKNHLAGITNEDLGVIYETPHKYYLDQQVFNAYNLKTNIALKDAQWVNKEIPLLFKYYMQILIGLLAIVCILLITYSYKEIKHKKNINKYNEELIKKNEELTKAIQEANTSNKAKSSFLANMSHEIRTPLNALIGMTNLAKEKAQNEETKYYLNQIESSSTYLLGVLNDILDMACIDSGKFELNLKWIKPHNTTNACIKMIEPLMKAKGIEFIYPKINAKFEVLLDELRYQQLLMNLLNNAYKFTGEHGKVTLAFNNISHDGENSIDEIIVSDTGCGMSEEFLEKVFLPFEQERSNTTSSIKGTGLGLALCKKIVEKMDGQITVESKVGVGTTFHVIIKYKYRICDSQKNIKAIDYDESILIDKHILLAEDNELNAEIAVELLKKKQMIVDVVGNGKEALEVFEKNYDKYDLILMDIRMPIMDGLDATKAIRALSIEKAASIPIVAMTANAFEEDVKTAMDSGMNAYLAKPVKPKVLYQTLAKELSESTL